LLAAKTTFQQRYFDEPFGTGMNPLWVCLLVFVEQIFFGFVSLFPFFSWCVNEKHSQKKRKKNIQESSAWKWEIFWRKVRKTKFRVKQEIRVVWCSRFFGSKKKKKVPRPVLLSSWVRADYFLVLQFRMKGTASWKKTKRSECQDIRAFHFVDFRMPSETAVHFFVLEQKIDTTDKILSQRLRLSENICCVTRACRSTKLLFWVSAEPLSFRSFSSSPPNKTNKNQERKAKPPIHSSAVQRDRKLVFLPTQDFTFCVCFLRECPASVLFGWEIFRFEICFWVGRPGAFFSDCHFF